MASYTRSNKRSALVETSLCWRYGVDVRRSNPKDCVIRRLKLVPVLHFGVNIQGALLTLIYFTVVEHVFFEERWGGGLLGVVKLFAVMWLIVLPAVHFTSLRPFYALIPRISGKV